MRNKFIDGIKKVYINCPDIMYAPLSYRLYLSFNTRSLRIHDLSSFHLLFELQLKRQLLYMHVF